MLVLFETAAGHALFTLNDPSILNGGKDKDSSDKSVMNDNLNAMYDNHFATATKACETIQLKAFSGFGNTADAVANVTDMVQSKLGKGLKKFLKKNCLVNGSSDEYCKLAVTDKALGALIKEKLGVQCVHDASVMELMRGIRGNMDALLTGMDDSTMKAMTLGLSHSLSRYKLKFSADKVDTMIVQAIGLLDELDKEINTYGMRVREWFGWHFPELGKIITDNGQYVAAVKKMGMRIHVASLDFSDILTTDIESAMKSVCEVSMGTEISEEDVLNIRSLCDQVLSLTEYRTQLYDYLKNRMAAIAPNLTVMVGELVGARLISHAGSLMNLAKAPASTVQILGAEKALFRALKTKHDTPKYGLIYHASLVGQAAPKNKGKISRVLAAKTALAIRVDALGDHTEATIGYDNKAKVEARLRQLEGTSVYQASGKGSSVQTKEEKYTSATPTSNGAYNASNDVVEVVKAEETDVKTEKKKKKKRKAEEVSTVVEEVADEVAENDKPAKKKSKKSKKSTEEIPVVEEEAAVATPLSKEKKKKKKKKSSEVAE